MKYGPHDRNVMDVWLAESDKPTPVVFYIHGGGWTGGDKKQAVERIQPYLDKGISYAAWREVGVPAAVLKKAGIRRVT